MYIKAEKNNAGLHKSMILKAVKLRWELWEDLSSCQDANTCALSKNVKEKLSLKFYRNIE